MLLMGVVGSSCLFFCVYGADGGGVLSRILSGRTVVDKIVARVNGANILISDLKQPRIDKNGDVYGTM